MSPTETKVLHFLAEHGSDLEHAFFAFCAIEAATQLPRNVVRRCCRSLKRKGLAEFGMGLWTEDGEPAGSGYAVTEAGRRVAKVGWLKEELDAAVAERKRWPPEILAADCDLHQTV